MKSGIVAFLLLVLSACAVESETDYLESRPDTVEVAVWVRFWRGSQEIPCSRARYTLQSSYPTEQLWCADSLALHAGNRVGSTVLVYQAPARTHDIAINDVKHTITFSLEDFNRDQVWRFVSVQVP